MAALAFARGDVRAALTALEDEPPTGAATLLERLTYQVRQPQRLCEHTASGSSTVLIVRCELVPKFRKVAAACTPANLLAVHIIHLCVPLTVEIQSKSSV